jgi:hypothetical protein|tara:strand:+ start:289 stop:939 length:651 start_codon:yes stop_codon:yes gene_type:complete
LVKTLFKIGFLLFTSVAVANQQDGSLNTYNGDGSNVNSNNHTQDDSVSNTYNGAGSSSEMPVGSAITPSYMSNGVETCLKGIGSSVQTVVVGWSEGKYKIDEECNRRRDAKVLSDLGMKVAAVARMCESVEVWRSMFISGTPCPILSNGRLIVGKRAFLVMKMNPETYIPDYNKKTKEWYNKILQIGENTDDAEEDNDVSVSDRFRSSLRSTGQPD